MGAGQFMFITGLISRPLLPHIGPVLVTVQLLSSGVIPVVTTVGSSPLAQVFMVGLVELSSTCRHPRSVEFAQEQFGRVVALPIIAG